MYTELQGVTGKQVLLTSSSCLLNYTPDNKLDIHTKFLLTIRFCFVLGRLNMWITQISACISLEKLTHDLNHKLQMFWRIWEP